MKIIVQKFGGTSVANEVGWEHLSSKVRIAKEQGYFPVIVVSAMGRYPAPYATDSLLSLIEPYSAFDSAVERDMLMACGEIISTVTISYYLRAQGIPAVAFSGAKAGIRTDSCFNEAQIISIDPSNILKALEEGSVPVIAGFQGIDSSGNTVTLGRGGSDTSAVALGIALNAEKVEIYTDVDGIMTSDPRCVEEARLLKHMTYLEVGEMAREGARVLHPRAVAMAKAHDISVVVRSTFSDNPGTLLVSEERLRTVKASDMLRTAVADSEDIGSSSENAVDIVDCVAGRGQVATGIVTVPGRCAINVDLAWAEEFQKARLDVLEIMANNKVSLDMIDVVGNHLYFLIKQSDLILAREYLRSLGYGFTICQNCAKVSVVGHNMRGVPGVMRRICRALDQECVPLLYATDSHITISCVVPEDKLSVAAISLHREFGLDKF